MGVSQFYKRFIRQHLRGQIDNLIQKSLWSSVSSLLLDANALIYEAKRFLFEMPKFHDATAAAKVVKNLELSQTAQYQLLAEQTWELIKARVQFIRPTKYVVIAFDGVVPVAKMKQQRSRRFRNQLLTAQGDISQNGPDTNLISVGTDLMEVIHEHIRKEINSLSYNYDTVFPSIVIYSSYHQVGEGEHKIVKYFRDNVIDHSTDEYHVIWGLDADLFMLGISLPTDKVILARDDGETEFVDLEKFKRYLAREMRTINFVDDFLIIMTMMGNDFLPRLFAFNDLSADIPVFLETFKALRLKDENFKLSENKLPDYDNLFKFVAELIPYQWQRIKDRIKAADSGFLSHFTQNDVKSQMPDLYYAREYSYINLGAEVEYDQETIIKLRTEMAYYYLQGISWILSYYRNGMESVNKSYFYPYITAPLLEDLNNDNYVAGPTNYWSNDSGYNIEYNILDQLLMTAPHNSEMLNWYSSQIRAAYDVLTDLAPESFLTTSESQKVQWFDEPLLPMLIPNDVHEITSAYYNDQNIFRDMPIQFKTEEYDIQLKRQLKVPEIKRTTSINQAPRGRFHKPMSQQQINLMRLTRGFQRGRG